MVPLVKMANWLWVKILVIAYTSFEGLGYEDAIAISSRLVTDDLLTSIHVEEYEADVVDTKLGPEELTRDIPNVGEAFWPIWTKMEL